MHCARCGFDSPAGKKFCGECGSPFTNRCPSCGEENPPQFKFCGECGTSLTGQFSVQRLGSSVKTGLGSSVQSLESEAEGCFLKAIEIARRQSAKSLELRAVMSLSR